MNANALKELVRNYNAHKEEIFDKITDNFTNMVKKGLDDIYNDGGWTKFFNCTQLGITVTSINENFSTFQFDFGYILYEGQRLEDDYQLIPFDEYVEKIKTERGNYWCCGFQDEEIPANLTPFVDALTRKGFSVFFDNDYYLVIGLDIV